MIPTTLDDLDELVDSLVSSGPRRQAAERLEALAAGSVDDGISRADLLLAAAELWQLEGDPDRGIALCRQAVQSGLPSRIDARAHLATALASVGAAEEARQLLAAVCRSRPSVRTLLFVGEQYEELGDLAEAHTCSTSGVVTAARNGRDFELALFLLARRRVRRAMGQPQDNYDDLADEVGARAEEASLRRGARDDRPARQPRNGSCACGSGRKYKRCCGRTADRSYGEVTSVVSTDGDTTFIDLVSR